MFFAEYIQKLHDCIEPETNRGDFTKNILELIVTNKEKVKYDSISSYNGFYDGKTQGKGDDKKIIGDKICNCAKKMVDYLDISEDKVNTLPRFKNYLKELRFNISAKKQLCDSFRCELPNINTDNYIDEISELLIKIIKEAASNVKTDATHQKVSTSEDDLLDNWYSQLEPPSPPFSEETLSCIDEIVGKMYKILIKIADLDLYQYIENSNPPHSSFLSKDRIIRHNKKCIPDEIYNKFLEYYNKLHELSIDLKYYSENHMYSPLNETVNSFTSITQNNYLYMDSTMYQVPLKVQLSLLSYAIQKLRK